MKRKKNGYLMFHKNEGEERVEAVEGNHAQKAHDVSLMFGLCVELEVFVDEIK